jgi:hypothetical protein
MIADIDIWRTARLLMRQRDDPEFYAAQRADELLAAGDRDGCRVWQRIGMAIRNLTERDPVCPTCRGALRVCAYHGWPESDCDCREGAPCPSCNAGDPQARARGTSKG